MAKNPDRIVAVYSVRHTNRICGIETADGRRFRMRASDNGGSFPRTGQTITEFPRAVVTDSDRGDPENGPGCLLCLRYGHKEDCPILAEELEAGWDDEDDPDLDDDGEEVHLDEDTDEEDLKDHTENTYRWNRNDPRSPYAY
jgi:hypothetical protein